MHTMCNSRFIPLPGQALAEQTLIRSHRGTLCSPEAEASQRHIQNIQIQTVLQPSYNLVPYPLRCGGNLREGLQYHALTRRLHEGLENKQRKHTKAYSGNDRLIRVK